MKEIANIFFEIALPIALIIIIVLAATRKELKGKPWLIAFLCGELVLSSAWRVFRLLNKLNIGTELLTTETFIVWFSLSLRILSLVVICLLIPYVIAAARGQDRTKRDIIEQTETASGNTEPVITHDKIRGWLIFPGAGLVLTLIHNVIWIFIGLASELPSLYGGTFLLILIYDVGFTVFVFYVLFCFLNRRRNTPVMIIALMVTGVAGNLIIGMISAVAEAQPLADAHSTAAARGFISAIIWIPYFLVSKRVKRTFVVSKEEIESPIERNATIEESTLHDCPDCGAGGIIPDENGKCTRCGYALEENQTGLGVEELPEN